MRIVILGASGQIGSTLFRWLRDRHNVVGISRTTLAGLMQFDPHRDDWTRLGTPDVLINCIGEIEASPAGLHKAHVDLARLIIKNHRGIGSPRLVQLSALGASPDHRVAFLSTKGIADRELLNLPGAVIIRPSIVCTIDTMLLKKLRWVHALGRGMGGFLFVPKGFLTTRVQPIMPEDLCAIVERACMEDLLLGVINAVGPDQFTFGDLVAMTQVKGRRIRVVELSRFIIDPLVALLYLLRPRLISPEQYQLVFEDNIADGSDTRLLLKNKPHRQKIFLSTN